MEYTAIFKKMDNGWYFAQCEQLPAAMTQGKTLAEAKENLKEAIALVLEDEKSDAMERNKGFKVLRRKIAIL